MLPTIYHSNLYALGTLSGALDTDLNPVERVADGSVNLSYEAATSAVASGEIQVTLVTAARPNALTLPRVDPGSAASVRFILESEDVGGGNNATELDFVVSDFSAPTVQAIGAGTARRVWRLTVSGAAGFGPVDVYEAQLATKYEFPRRPIVPVDRARVRQHTRFSIAGGQPFVKRDGPTLRRTLYTTMLTSGSQISGAEAFVDAVDGGQSFTLVDDRAETYWAEMLGSEIPFQDEAGVYTWSPLFQEVNAEQ